MRISAGFFVPTELQGISAIGENTTWILPLAVYPSDP
jgi:hypothetical protein